MTTSKKGDANRNEKAIAQLGMTMAVARNKLIKSILLHFARLCNMDGCYVCGDKIESIDVLSIEHKKPWLDIDAALYWDIENIAFSHVRCNRPHRKPGAGPAQRKKRGDDESWCSGCEAFLHKSLFYEKPQGRWNGLSSECKKCHCATVRRYLERKRSQSSQKA